MDSAEAIIELQHKVTDLESRLSLLSKWISIKFGDDSFPAKLLSGPASELLLVETDKISTVYNYEDAHNDQTATNNCLINYTPEPLDQPRTETVNRTTRRRKQKLSNKEPDYEIIVPDATLKEEVNETEEGIRVVDMTSIINASADESNNPPASRTRQPYVCSTCKRKFRSQTLLDNHKMTHCYVQFTAMDSITIKPFITEDEIQYSDSNPDPRPDYEADDMDFQPIHNDSDTEASNSTETEMSTKNKANSASNSGDFQCNICQKKFSKARYVKDHIRYKHCDEFVKTSKPRAKRNTGDFQCDICPKIFTKERYLRDHMRLNHFSEYQVKYNYYSNPKVKQNMGDFQCNVCHRKFTKERYLRDHMRLNHFTEYQIRYNSKPKLKQNTGEFDCPACPKKFAHERNMRQHLKLCNQELYDEQQAATLEIEKYQCKLCQDSFNTNYLLKQHRIGSHPEEYKNELEKDKAKKLARKSAIHQCKICNNGEIYTAEHLLRKHKETAHDIPYNKSSFNAKCEDCGAAFTSRSGLLQHKQSVHLKSRPCLCPQCGKGFSRKYDLQVHMEIHSEKRLYQCEQCPKSFRQKAGLVIHIKRHAGAQVQCVQCGQFFASLGTLKNHETEIHAGIRAHPCPKCSKSFKKKTHLNYHLKTHENPNGRKRGLNQSRGVLPKREANRLQVQRSAVNDVSASAMKQEIEVTVGALAEAPNYAMDSQAVVAADNNVVVENVPAEENWTFSLRNFDYRT